MVPGTMLFGAGFDLPGVSVGAWDWCNLHGVMSNLWGHVPFSKVQEEGPSLPIYFPPGRTPNTLQHLVP